MKRTLMLVIVLASIALTGTAVAQSATTTPPPTTAADSDPYEMVLPGDSSVKVVEYNYDGDRMELVIQSDRPKLLTLTSAPSTSRGTGAGIVKRASVTKGKTRVTIAAPSGVVWISTSESVSNGRFGYIKATGNAMPVNGPWDGADVRNAAIGGAAIVAFMSLFHAMKIRRGTAEEGERLA